MANKRSKTPSPLPDAGRVCAKASASAPGTGPEPSANPRPAKRPGRPKGSSNKFNQSTREVILKAGKPVDVLCRIAAGKPLVRATEPGAKGRVKVYPTLAESKEAARTLLPFVLPSLKALELSGPDGAPVKMSLVDFLAGLPK